jgi:NADPH:quinone reductase-like Zn-dependent oxidoreductase
VAELGEGVTQWAVGDEVFGLVGGVSTRLLKCMFLTDNLKLSRVFQGAYAEFVNCDEGLLLKKPGHLSWVEAASIPENYITGEYGRSAN